MKTRNLIFILGFVAIFVSCQDNSVTTGPDKPDISHTDSLKYDDIIGSNVAAYIMDGRKWDNNNITYYFVNGTSDINSYQEQQAIENAMEMWASFGKLTFSEVNYAFSADIRISFATGTHGDDSPFDGINGTLAHAFYPPPNGGALAGDMHFDDAEAWTLNTRPSSSQPIDLVTVAAHELGHALGLGHSSKSGALMWGYYTGSHRYLSQDDVNGIQELYGQKFAVYIHGPTAVYEGDTPTWTVNINAGSPPFDYEWYRRTYYNGTWQGWILVSTGDSYTDPNVGEYDYTIKVKVTDSNSHNSQYDKDYHPVAVGGFGGF